MSGSLPGVMKIGGQNELCYGGESRMKFEVEPVERGLTTKFTFTQGNPN
jgi:hypothetical protein